MILLCIENIAWYNLNGMKIKIKKIPSSLHLRGKTVLVRVDFNTPLHKTPRGTIVVTDDWRIQQSVSTLTRLSRLGARIVLISHIGRPDGKVVEGLRMQPVVKALSKLLPDDIAPVHVHHDWNFDAIRDRIDELDDGDILCLENVRFIAGEEQNDKNFAKSLAELGDIFVNEAFSVSHRAHASIHAITRYLPSYAGYRLVEELTALEQLTTNPKQPLVVIIGGAKVEDKLVLASALTKNAVTVLTGGVVGNTVLQAMGHHMGRSKVGEKKSVRSLLALSKKKKRSDVFGSVPYLLAPVDVVVKISGSARYRVVDFEDGDRVRATEIAVDIGPKTVLRYAGYLRGAKTMVWNGPMGLIEEKPFDISTRALAQLFASRAKGRAFGVIGGGDLLSVFNSIGMSEHLDYCSTGGGAMLEYLAGKKLPGVAVLKK